uniref:Uncharacterized protein n=1 Tax=Monodopsis sp. MarTras21 TaxID=1745953 RepID=A0A1D8RDK9_9STRA|nr:hypothetical protein [Monodopsis sp. MarTras21]
MEKEKLTKSKIESELQVYSKNVNQLFLIKHQTLLLFNLYDNRLVHEKFLEQLFENLIESKKLLKYDFQKKIYSIYPNINNFKIKIVNKFKILASLSIFCLLLKYIRYKKLIFDNFIFLKIYLKTFSYLFNSKLSLIFLILRKRYRYLKIRLYKVYNTIKHSMFNLYKLLVLNYLNYKLLINVNFSSESYKKYYQLHNN